jgi:hypothetical protein
MSWPQWPSRCKVLWRSVFFETCLVVYTKWNLYIPCWNVRKKLSAMHLCIHLCECLRVCVILCLYMYWCQCVCARTCVQACVHMYVHVFFQPCLVQPCSQTANRSLKVRLFLCTHSYQSTSDGARTSFLPLDVWSWNDIILAFPPKLRGDEAVRRWARFLGVGEWTWLPCLHSTFDPYHLRPSVEGVLRRVRSAEGEWTRAEGAWRHAGNGGRTKTTFDGARSHRRVYTEGRIWWGWRPFTYATHCSPLKRLYHTSGKTTKKTEKKRKQRKSKKFNARLNLSDIEITRFMRSSSLCDKSDLQTGSQLLQRGSQLLQIRVPNNK